MLKILHLYYDIMNIYGENGNFRALVKILEEQKEKLQVDYKSVDDKVNIKDYDFIYIGCGLDSSYDIVLNDIKRFKNDLKNYIDNNGFILVTGNALNLFSDLGILDFKYKHIDFRIVGDQIFNTTLIDKKVIGFQNRNTIMEDVKEVNLFCAEMGTGYNPKERFEGIKKKNFYGTYLVGPLLVRNPYLRDYIIEEFMKSKNLKYIKSKEEMPYLAYDNYLKTYDTYIK